MFTGIVSNQGRVKRLEPRGTLIQLSLILEPEGQPFSVGESIAVNGVCLTLTAFKENSVDFDVSSETLDRSTLGEVSSGEPVNIERSLRLGDPLGGHWVLGHVDGVGKVTRIEIKGENRVFHFWAPPEVREYVVFKGSIAVDGVSLTIAEVEPEGFTVALIPHTARITTLGNKRVGDKVNLEADIIGKYVRKFLTGKDLGKKEITPEFLKAHGFL